MGQTSDTTTSFPRRDRVPSDFSFFAISAGRGGGYLVLIALLIIADFAYLAFSERGVSELLRCLADEKIRYSIWLSLISCTISAILSLWVAIPIGYLMSRFNFRGKNLIDTLLDVPIVLPPLVIGLSLLILFNIPPFSLLSEWVVYEIPAVILAQFTVACAFAVRTMRVTFDQIPQRFEKVALTLGCNRGEAFKRVVMPQAKRGIVAAGTLAWARALGEFGPILVFASSTRLRTEVLSTSVYLEMQAGNLDGMLAISILMIMLAALVLLLARSFGIRRLQG